MDNKQSDATKKMFTTDQAGERLGAKGPTLRHSLCLKGHYLGIRPVKLPNGRLLWPADAIDRLLSGEAAR